MSDQTTRKTFSEELAEHKAAFEAVGWVSAPADHPVYRQGGYMIHFTNPTDASSKSSPTKANSQPSQLANFLTSLTTSKT